MRKIAVVSGTRADYGLLYWIIKGINDDPNLKLQLIVTGTHLSPKYGLTIKNIEEDGFPVSTKVWMRLLSDTEKAVAMSMGEGMIGFAKAYESLKPDILVVLGDRYEILAAVAAAASFRIPIAHIHGGESTEGAVDELFRHAVTKMSHIHFPATKMYAERIVQMGENPKNVFCFGSPAIDNVNKLNLLTREALFADLVLPLGKKLGVVTYHPVTLENNTAGGQIREILRALKEYEDVYWVFTYPNADTGGRIIIKSISDFLKSNPTRGRVFISLGQMKYLSLLKHADLMVGNSSSGLIEAPSFMLPVVNIGDRQKGRIKAANILDVRLCEKDRILAAITKAVSNRFKYSISKLKNPYGCGNASFYIVKTLSDINLDSILQKNFFQNV